MLFNNSAKVINYIMLNKNKEICLKLAKDSCLQAFRQCRKTKQFFVNYHTKKSVIIRYSMAVRPVKSGTKCSNEAISKSKCIMMKMQRQTENAWIRKFRCLFAQDQKKSSEEDLKIKRCRNYALTEEFSSWL